MFKPELRRLAVERVVRAVVAGVGVEAEVSVSLGADGRPHAEVALAAHAAEVETALARHAFSYRVSVVQE